MLSQIRSAKFWLGVIIILIALPLIAYTYLGIFNRPMADDFCFTHNVQSLGLLENVSWYYTEWTGTYSSTFFQSVIGLTNNWHLTPVILITLFSIVAIWVAYQWVRTFQLTPIWHTAGILGLLLAFAIITGTANTFQSFYWTSGGITYASPLILFLFHIGILLYLHRQPRFRMWHGLLIAVIMLVAGGFSPLVSIFQIAFFALMLILIWRFSSTEKKSHDLMLIGLSLTFIIIAFVLVFIAPGNLARQATFDNQYTLSEIATLTGIETIRFLATAVVVVSPVALLVPMIISGIIAFHYHPLTSKERFTFSKYTYHLLGVSTFIGLILIASSFFTTLYSIGELPPPRAYVTMQTILVVMSMCWGYLMGLGLRLKHQPTHLSLKTLLLMIIVVATGSLYTLAKPVSLVPEFQSYAETWDEHDTLLKSLEPDQPPFELVDFTKGFTSYYWLRDPHLYCIRDYYQQPNLTFPESEITFFR